MARGRPLQILWQEDAATLFQAYRKEKLPDLKPRLQGLWLLRLGYQMEETAKVVGVHYRTLQQWVAWYRQGGLGEVVAHRKVGQGRAAKLTVVQQAQFRQQVAQGAFRTAQAAVDWLAQAFGVHYTRSSIYSLLVRLEGRPKVPRPLATKASLEVQERWKKGD